MTARLPDDPLCKSVLARLKARMPKHTPDFFPDDPEKYPWVQKEKMLLVGYDGATFGDPETIDPVSCEERTLFSVTVVCRGLRGDFGLAGTLRDVRKALFGWTPTHIVQVGEPPAPEVQSLGYSPCFIVNVQFVKEDQGIWIYAVQFRANTVVVSDVTDPEVSGEPLGTLPERSLEMEDPE